MAKHKSPFTEDVAREWEALAFPKRELHAQEKTSRWAELYGRTRSKGEWTVNSYDAGLVATMGAGLATDEKDWARAAALLDEYLAHPQAGVDAVTYNHVRAERAGIAILMGEVEAGIATMRAMLTQKKHASLTRLEVRVGLLRVLAELGDRRAPDQAICELVADTISKYRGNKRKARSARLALSHHELFEILQRSFTRPPAR